MDHQGKYLFIVNVKKDEIVLFLNLFLKFASSCRSLKHKVISGVIIPGEGLIFPFYVIKTTDRPSLGGNGIRPVLTVASDYRR